MTFGTWNARNLYEASSLEEFTREIPKYKRDLLLAQEVRLETHGDLTCLYGNGNRNNEFWAKLFIHYNGSIFLASRFGATCDRTQYRAYVERLYTDIHRA
jgi:hypothetical protein